MEELLLWLGLGAVGYFLSKKKDEVAGKVKKALEGARKFLTYVAIIITFSFLAGMFYAFFVLGCSMSGLAFWAPIALFFLLVIYYYL